MSEVFDFKKRSTITPSAQPLQAGWFCPLNSKRSADYRLICFPYAGGDGIGIYRKWPDFLPHSADIYAAQLPGRGMRIAEAPFTNVQLAAEALAANLLPFLDKPFAFFGHSLGAKVCFEVARLLKAQAGVQPFHLFAAGSVAPRMRHDKRRTFDLPEAEFLRSIQDLNGTPHEVLTNRDLMTLLMPLLRADFEAAQTYTYADTGLLDCPITVFGGVQDIITFEELEPWQRETTGVFSYYMLPGDHFFINTSRGTLLQKISSHLLESYAKR